MVTKNEDGGRRETRSVNAAKAVAGSLKINKAATSVLNECVMRAFAAECL